MELCQRRRRRVRRWPRRWPRLRWWVAEERLTGNSTFNKHDHVCLQAEFELTLQIHDSCNDTVVSPCAHLSCPPLISTPATNGRLPTCTQRLPSPNLPAPTFLTIALLAAQFRKGRVSFTLVNVAAALADSDVSQKSVEMTQFKAGMGERKVLKLVPGGDGRLYCVHESVD